MNNDQGIHLPLGSWERAVRYGHTLYVLLRTAWTEYEHDYARYLAGAMVYYALVSLIPLLLLLLSALGLLLRFSELAADGQLQVLLAVESRFGTELRTTVEQLVDALKQVSVTAIIVSIITLLFTASVLFRQLRLSFRAIWKYPPPMVAGSIWVVARASIVEQAAAFFMVLAGGGLLIGSLVLIAANQWLNGYLDTLPRLSRTLGWLLTVLSPMTVAAIMFGFLFKFLPPAPLRWRDVWLAALLCAGAWALTNTVLTLSGAFFGSNRTAYGAFSSLLVVLLWMNVMSQLLFFGAELCKVVALKSGGSTLGGS